MPRRNSPNDITHLSDLSRLSEIVVDKRQGKRAEAKKGRRNRHYENQFIRNALSSKLGLSEDVGIEQTGIDVTAIHDPIDQDQSE